MIQKSTQCSLICTLFSMCLGLTPPLKETTLIYFLCIFPKFLYADIHKYKYIFIFFIYKNILLCTIFVSFSSMYWIFSGKCKQLPHLSPQLLVMRGVYVPQLTTHTSAGGYLVVPILLPL